MSDLGAQADDWVLWVAVNLRTLPTRMLALVVQQYSAGVFNIKLSQNKFVFYSIQLNPSTSSWAIN